MRNNRNWVRLVDPYSRRFWIALILSVPFICAASMGLTIVVHMIDKFSLVMKLNEYISEYNFIQTSVTIVVICILSIKLPIVNDVEKSDNLISNSTLRLAIRLVSFFLWYMSMYVCLSFGLQYVSVSAGLETYSENGLYISSAFSLLIGLAAGFFSYARMSSRG